MSDILSKLEALEKKVANAKDWKKAYEDGKKQWEKESTELLKTAGIGQKIKDLLVQLLGVPALGNPSQSGAKTLNLDHQELIVNLSHSEKELNMTTATVVGKVLFCASTELPGEGFSEAELSEALKEHGWNVGHNTLAPALGGLVRDGNLVKLEVKPTKYRLPQKVKLNIVDKPGNTG